MEFKVGQRVKTKKGFSFDPSIGTIVEIRPPNIYMVKIERILNKSGRLFTQDINNIKSFRNWAYYKEELKPLGQSNPNNPNIILAE